jgi:predicted metal-dependent hydrolase
MHTRYPDFDFSTCTPDWVPGNREVAHSVDAMGIVPAYIEPFLIKVMNRAKAELDPERDAELIRDIDIFNKQEGQHFKFHRAYMKMLRDNGYASIKQHEADYEADYDRFLATKSLRWLVAYCEGFEATGSGTATYWVDELNSDMLQGADRRPIELWRWHLAEEYEHRMVMFTLYHRLYGQRRVRAYFYRLYGFYNSTMHIQRYVMRTAAEMMATDRATMTPAEVKASKHRDFVAKRQSARQSVGVLRALSPFYNPAKSPPPKRLASVLATYDSPTPA